MRYKLFLLTLILFINSAFADDTQIDTNKLAKEVVNGYLPEYIQLNYLSGKDGNESSWAIEYDYLKKGEDSLSFKQNGNNYDFGNAYFTFFVKGSYAFEEEANTENLSEVGGTYTKRWFNIKSLSRKLNPSESNEVQKCVIDNINLTVDDCRDNLGYGRTTLSHTYLDLDFHLKVEGNQDYSERNYVYGAKVNFSLMPEPSSLLHSLNVLEYPSRLLKGFNRKYYHFPVFTLGLEQVDPSENMSRKELGESDVFDRVYIEVSHTSPLGKIKGYPVKLNYNYRYYKEIDAPETIKVNKIDSFEYYSLALLLPTSIIPGYTGDDSNFILSYSSGEMPFSHTDEKVFKIGWRTNVDFGGMFSP